MSSPETSLSLLLRLRSGTDIQAWNRFVDLYAPLMVRWAERLGNQAADAEDLVQEVFVTLVTALPRFEYDQCRSFRAWLRTVLTNKCSELRRKKSLVFLDASQGMNDAAQEMAEYWDEDEDRAVLCRQALELIRPGFSPVTWQAFTATAMQGRSVAETAQLLGITPNAIYLARGRILSRLRQELEGLWD